MPGNDSTYAPVSLATTPTPPNLPPTSAVTAAPATRGGGVATRHIAWGRPPSIRRHGRGDHGGATIAGRHRHPERHRPVGARARATAAAAIGRGGDLHRRPSLRRSGESRPTSVRSPSPPLSSAVAVVAVWWVRPHRRRRPVVGPTEASEVTIEPGRRGRRHSERRALATHAPVLAAARGLVDDNDYQEWQPAQPQTWPSAAGRPRADTQHSTDQSFAKRVPAPKIGQHRMPAAATVAPPRPPFPPNPTPGARTEAGADS